jgi:type II restriction enzyme
MESALGQALTVVVGRLSTQFALVLRHRREWPLQDVVARLRSDFPEVDFYEPRRGTSMRPDGGILSIVDAEDREYPILISEVKNQGTNDLRQQEGLPRQAQGNAVERLGKNVIGFRTALLREGIVPFVCFGHGIDFEVESSILDRVATIAMFGHLNRLCVVNEGESGQFNRGSFFFRREPWQADEIERVLFDVASRAIYYYFARYGLEHFLRAEVDIVPQ